MVPYLDLVPASSALAGAGGRAEPRPHPFRSKPPVPERSRGAVAAIDGLSQMLYLVRARRAIEVKVKIKIKIEGVSNL